MTVKKDNDLAMTRQDLHGTINEPTYAGVASFMRRKYTRDITGVDLVVTGIPLDSATTNRPGARFGPRGIRAASTTISWMRPYNTLVDPFDKPSAACTGDQPRSLIKARYSAMCARCFEKQDGNASRSMSRAPWRKALRA